MDISLQILVLGVPLITYQEHQIRFRSRKVLALLVYLVVNERRHSRDELMSLLWPDSDYKRARVSLRNAIFHLRQALAFADDILLIEGEQVSFDFTVPITSDIALVKAAIEDNAGVLDLEAAVAVIRGEFLSGFHINETAAFEEWINTQRGVWYHHIQSIQDRLCHHYLETMQFSKLIPIALNWLKQTSTSETAYRYLMQAYALQGKTALALQTYESCCTMLATELDIEPSVATIGLAERIRANEFQVNKNTQQISQATPGIDNFLYVGRAIEQKQLFQSYQLAREGQPQVVVIIGEAGVGKTRTAEMFLRRLALQQIPPDIIKGQAHDMGGRIPYQSLTAGLRIRLDKENAPEDLLSDVWLSELTRLFPELLDRYPDLPEPLAGDTEFVRGRLFEAITTFIQSLAEQSPIVLSLEDIQWADLGTLDLLHYLVRRWLEMGSRVLLIMTIRQEALLTNTSLANWLTALSHNVSLKRLELSLLELENTHDLVRELRDGTSDRTLTASELEFSQWLFRETGGSPFHIHELLKMLMEEETLRPSSDKKDYFDTKGAMQYIKQANRPLIPQTIRDVILARLNHLSEDGRSIATAIAVIGRACRYETVCQISGIDEMDGLSALERLLESRILVEGSLHTYRLAHDNIREIVYTQAGEARRRIFHKRALIQLKIEQAPASELAFHAHVAGMDEEAFQYSIKAGDQASHIFASKDAAYHYAIAIDLLPQIETTSTERRHLSAKYGRALELTSDFGAALEHYQRMQDWARQIDDAALYLEALLGEGILRVISINDLKRAEAIGEEALALAQSKEDTVSEATIQWHLMNVYRSTDRFDLAIKAGTRALRLAKAHDLHERLAYILHDLAAIYISIDWVASLTYNEQAMTLWRELNNTPMYLESMNLYSLQQSFIGKYDEALKGAEETFEIGTLINNQWALTYSYYVMTSVYLQKMEISNALTAAKTSLAIARESDTLGGQITMNFLLGMLYLEVGADEHAEKFSKQAYILTEQKLPLLAPITAGLFALVKIETGDFDTAGKLLDNIVYNPEDPDRLQLTIPEKAVGVYALYQQNFTKALQVSESVLATLEHFGITLFAPDFYYIKAQALIGLDRIADAETILLHSLQTLRNQNQRWYFIKIATLLIELNQSHNLETDITAIRDEVTGVISNIRSNINDQELEGQYLNLPGVKAILNT